MNYEKRLILLLVMLIMMSGCGIREDMPAFSDNLQTISDNLYYIEFDNDNYPCKKMGDELLPHPIYGVYVINDYIAQYQNTSDFKYLKAASLVADAAINRMVEKNNALLFYYPKGFMDYSAFYKEMYSGLTQIYYAESFYKLYDCTSDVKYLNASNKCINSLSIPVGEGGVLWEIDGHKYIAEYPFEVPDLVLNGSLSIGITLMQYGELNEKRKEECDYLAKCQFETISNYLELFDIPSIHTSRYMISGPMIFQIDATSEIAFSEVVVDIPDVGFRKLEIKNPDTTTYYDSFIYGDYTVQNSLKINVMTSRISYPKENIIRISYSAPEAGTISFYGYVGEQSPIYVDLINPQLTQLGEYAYEPGGGGQIEIAIPWINDYCFGNPAVFNYVGSNGYHYNSYHYSHIDFLKEAYELTGDVKFKDYADRWENYINLWKYDEIWNQEGISFEPYH